MAFLSVFLAILVSGYLFLATQLLTPLELPGAWAWLSWLLLLLPFALIAWLPLVYWRKDSRKDSKDEPDASRRDDRMLWAAYFSMGGLSFLLAFTVLRELTVLGARAWGLVSGAWTGAGFIGSAAAASAGWLGGPSRLPVALLDWRGSMLILALSIIALAVGFSEARRTPRVTRVEVPIAGLAPGLEGLTIAQISDLHVGSTIQGPFVERVVRAVNELRPDLVALTGDLVDGTVRQLGPHFAPLAGLEAPLGRYYVTGNHEYYWEAGAWIEEARRLGITPLLNTHAIIERGGDRAVVAGVLDFWAERESGDAKDKSDPAGALRGAPSEATLRILLAHQPKAALEATSLGYDLQLSGHTHGGQFMPWTVVIRWFQPYARGLHRVGRMWLYVNRGTGYWGPPVRLGSPSEITLLRLTRA